MTEASLHIFSYPSVHSAFEFFSPMNVCFSKSILIYLSNTIFPLLFCSGVKIKLYRVMYRFSFRRILNNTVQFSNVQYYDLYLKILFFNLRRYDSYQENEASVLSNRMVCWQPFQLLKYIRQIYTKVGNDIENILRLILNLFLPF